MPPKPVCLIGGGGFIGSQLRRRLGARGVPVVILGRSAKAPSSENESYLSINELGWERVCADLERREFSAIVDLAYTSVPNTSFADPARDVSENLGTVLRHLDLCTRLRPEKFVYVSSGGAVYGEGAGAPLTEKASNFPLSPYGVTKLACERYVYLYYKVHGLPAIIARPSNVYGPGQAPFRGQGLVSTAFGSAFCDAPLTLYGDGSQIRDYLYVDDLCEALDHLITYAAPGDIVNIGSGIGLRAVELLTMISELSAERGRALDIVFEAARPFDVKYSVLDCSHLRAITPWEPQTSLRDGLISTRDWIETFLKTP